MAFDSDDETGPGSDARRKRGGPASQGDPAGRTSVEGGEGLGALEAGLPRADRTEDREEPIDAAALAALSQGKPSQRPLEDTEGGAPVRLAGASALATDRFSSAPPPPRPSGQPSGASPMRWVVPLLIGMALGVPIGGLVFPRGEPPAPAGPASEPPPPAPPAPLSAAEVRARATDEQIATVRLPVPAAAQARSGSEATSEGEATEPPAGGPAASGEGLRPGTHAAPEAASASGRERFADPKPAPAGPDSKPSARASEPTQPGAALAATPQATPAPATEPAPESPQPAVTPPPPAADRPDTRTVDQLLDDALASSGQQPLLPRADGAPARALPVTPSREDVTRAMTVLLPAIRGCAAGQSGLATVHIVVRNDGRVANATVSGAPFEGQRTGRCMAGVVRRAKFPRFQQSTFRVQFPFAIQ